MGLKAAWNALIGRHEAVPEGPKRVHEPEPESFQDAQNLLELAQQVHAHHAEITQLRLEWAETLDKFTAWSNRQAARDRVRMKRAMQSMEPDGEPEPTSEQPTFFEAGSGAPSEPPNGGNGFRHPKADLYARIRR